MKPQHTGVCLALSMSVILGLAACSNEPTQPAASTASTPAATEASTPTHAASHPVAASSTVAEASVPTATTSDAGDCQFDLEGNDAMTFNTKTITVPASCAQFTIKLSHVGKMPKAAMGHNVVVTASSDVNKVIADGLKAGAAQDYVKSGDERVLAKTKLLGGGESDSITLDVSKLKAAPHTFVCTFPGHSGPMRGNIEVK